jgi:hypothetical protein
MNYKLPRYAGNGNARTGAGSNRAKAQGHAGETTITTNTINETKKPSL